MRLIAKVASAAAVLPLLVTACSSASSPGLASSGGATADAQATPASASPAAANPNAGLFTGTQLKAMLEPASFFPSSFAADPSGSVDTGDTYQPPAAPGKLPCSRLLGTAWIDLSDIGSVSFAQSDFIDKTTTEEYAQEIDVYQGTRALSVMAALRKLPATCQRFKDSQTGGAVTVKLGRGPALGDGSLSLTLADPRWLGGTTLEAVRVRTAIVTVLYSAAAGTGATQAKVLASLIAGKLVQKSLSSAS